MKYLIVKPQGGLANRMRVVEAAYNYSRSSGASLTIVWEKNYALNADYSVCFAPLKGVRMIDANYQGDGLIAKSRRSFFNSLEYIGLKVFTTKTLNDPDINPVLSNEKPGEASKVFFDKLAQHHKGLFIETCLEFYPNVFNFRLPIQTDIKLKAYHLLEKYPSVIGIHIRRTDNVASISHSPIEKFIEKIDTSLQQTPSVSFYLSTDAEDVVEELRTLYRDKIITGATVRTRESKEGIVSALVDMCCLSQCKKIYGSFNSSFSERAAIIGNIPLQIIST